MSQWNRRDAAGACAASVPASCDGAARRVAQIVLAAAIVLLLQMVGAARGSERMVEIVGKRQVSTITVTAGKSETVRTDKSFANVVIGDPDVADAVPLSDHSLSILGKKIGTTRVSVYLEGKTLAGVFDVEVSYDVSKLSTELAARFPSAHFKVSPVNGRIMLSGIAPDAVTLDKAMTIARQFGPDVINAVRVAQPQQVMLEVRFVEASRTAGRDLGVQWKVVSKNLTATIGNAALLSGNAPFGVVVGKLLGNGVEVDPMINALEEQGLARRLAEPNLVTLSGETASFLAGGEIPIPVSNSFGQVTVDYKKYGVGLAFTPTVLDKGLINLKIEPEVSQIDPNNFFQAGQIRIPALIVRRANTTIELRDGQSFAIAGLLQNVATTNQAQLPWVGDLPVIGALMRSASYQKQETDLVIIVTPRLVAPMRPGDTIRTPLDNTAPANDADLFLLGRGEVPAKLARNAAADQTAKPIGHFLDLSDRTTHAQ